MSHNREGGAGSFVSVNGVICAGAHYIVDLFGGTGLAIPLLSKQPLRKAHSPLEPLYFFQTSIGFHPRVSQAYCYWRNLTSVSILGQSTAMRH